MKYLLNYRRDGRVGFVPDTSFTRECLKGKIIREIESENEDEAYKAVIEQEELERIKKNFSNKNVVH